MAEPLNFATMAAGREIDVLIHERVLGLCAHNNTTPRQRELSPGRPVPQMICTGCGLNVSLIHPQAPSYSTSLERVWPLVARYAMAVLPPGYSQTQGDRWLVKHGGAYWRLDDVDAETAPLAICRAALLAIERKHPHDNGDAR
jgi:hypothetical protein